MFSYVLLVLAVTATGELKNTDHVLFHDEAACENTKRQTQAKVSGVELICAPLETPSVPVPSRKPVSR